SLRRSDDGGASWKAVAELRVRGQRVYRNGERVFVLGPDFVAVWQGTLQTFPHPAFADSALGFDDGKAIFYGASNEGVFVSEDGEHWSKGFGGRARAVDASLRNGRVAYVSYSDGQGFGVA